MTNPQTRAADLDRSAMCATLDKAYADGQLDAAEHEERLSRAMAAKTLGDLDTLIADLQPVRDEPPAVEQQTSRLPGGRAIWVAGAAGLVAGIIMAALVIQVWRPGPSHPGVQFSIEGQIPVGAKPIVVSVPQLQTVDGFNALIGATRATFGNTVVTHMTVFSDYAEVTRPTSASPTDALHYLFRGGYQIPTPATRVAGAPDADLAKLDVGKIIGLVVGASQSLRVPDPTVLYFEVDGADGGTVTIHANNGFAQSGSLVAGFDGTVRQVNRFTS